MDRLLWYVGRASGLTAWWLAGLSVLFGLLLSTRALGARPKPVGLLSIHRYLGGLTVSFLALHVAALVADRHARLGWRAAAVPFASAWRPGPLAWGITALYLMFAVEITSLLRRHIRPSWWRAVHSTAFIVFATATVHAFTIGSDAHDSAVQWSGLVLGGAFFFLVTYRALVGGRARDGRRRSPVRPAEEGH